MQNMARNLRRSADAAQPQVQDFSVSSLRRSSHVARRKSIHAPSIAHFIEPGQTQALYKVEPLAKMKYFSTVNTAGINVKRQPWFHLLRNYAVENVVDMRKAVVLVSPEDPLRLALQKLSLANVQSCVVVEDGKPKGFVDVLDIMKNVLDQISVPRDQLSTQDLLDISVQGSFFDTQPCKQVMSKSGKDPLIIVTPKTPLLEAVEYFQDTHHAAIVDDTGLLHGVIAQWDIILFLLHRHAFVGSVVDKPMSEVGLVPEEVVGSLDWNTPVHSCMRYMSDCMVSGIAITDKEGQLVTNFSASDIVGITGDKFFMLGQPVEKFLRQKWGYLKPPICVNIEDTMETVMLKFHTYKVHRIYVVDNKMKPTGVLSLTDVMKYLVHGTNRV